MEVRGKDEAEEKQQEEEEDLFMFFRLVSKYE
jgi:hypothetical protein